MFFCVGRPAHGIGKVQNFFAKTFLPRNENILQRLESKPDVHSASSPKSPGQDSRNKKKRSFVSHDILKLNVIAIFCAKDNWHKWQSQRDEKRKFFGKNPVTQFVLFSSRCELATSFHEECETRDLLIKLSATWKVTIDTMWRWNVLRWRDSVCLRWVCRSRCVIRWSNICEKNFLWTQLRIW